jgi:hypothetical protein
MLSRDSAWAFGIVGGAVGLLGLLVGAWFGPGRRWPGLASAALGLAALGACSMAAGYPISLGWPLLALAGLLLLFGAARSDLLAGALAAAAARARQPRWQWAALAVGCPVTAALLALGARPEGQQDARATEARRGEEAPKPPPPPPHRRLPPGTALTDRGADVPLWEASTDPAPEAALRAAESWTFREYDLWGRVIRVAPPNRGHNCHGWVFTGGRYLLPDEAVEPILADNGYRRVERPRAGDLVVYRNDHGVVCHTALVWAVGEDGTVLLESKWSWVGRYLHPPAASPFGRAWAYYRSPRRGHQLRIAPVPKLPGASSPNQTPVQ